MPNNQYRTRGGHEAKFKIDMGLKYRIRKITPTECLRFMDVDECHIKTLTTTMEIAKNGKQKQMLSNSALYRLAGNSIVVSVMERLFENLFFPSEDAERGDQLQLF